MRVTNRLYLSVSIFVLAPKSTIGLYRAPDFANRVAEECV
jgi:hypothetical protein